MARKSSSNAKSFPNDQLTSHTLILDNGAHTIKAGFSSATPNAEPDFEKDCHVIANCIARSQRDKRTYVGSELLDECWDFGGTCLSTPCRERICSQLGRREGYLGEESY